MNKSGCNNLQLPVPPSSVSYAPSGGEGSFSGSTATSAAVSPAVVSKNPMGADRQQGDKTGTLVAWKR